MTKNFITGKTEEQDFDAKHAAEIMRIIDKYIWDNFNDFSESWGAEIIVAVRLLAMTACHLEHPDEFLEDVKYMVKEIMQTEGKSS